MDDRSERRLPLAVAVQNAFSELDAHHTATLSRLSASRRLVMVCDLADFAWESYAIQARARRPDANTQEIRADVVRRMMLRDG